MSDKYYLIGENRTQPSKLETQKGDARKVELDCSRWSELNGTVTTATWSVEDGQAAISSEALSSNVATAIITTSEIDRAMIKVLITDGTHSRAWYLLVKTDDPSVLAKDDYGLVANL